ncbi:hypothetical protein LSG31_09160 [Fodinisporobacter ferrooxydans]|uniref:Transposase n=1 Tax=Fodinisporobacter ferrooxydans TaxID=2901836 RepID=A0ABY4CP88_9BACL|nr:hypothetical protein LSG31_09160 [Alicyclobacillaceae bacterium MYW30-H2]
MLQDVAKRLDKAFQAFFHRVKAGEKPGFPRFKPVTRYDSFTYPQGGYAIVGNKLKLSKIGDIKIKLHRLAARQNQNLHHHRQKWQVLRLPILRSRSPTTATHRKANRR